MKRLIAIIILLYCGLLVHGQTVVPTMVAYSYDGAGNRVASYTGFGVRVSELIVSNAESIKKGDKNGAVAKTRSESFSPDKSVQPQPLYTFDDRKDRRSRQRERKRHRDEP